MNQREAFERDGQTLFPQALDISVLQRFGDFAGSRKRSGKRLDAATLAPIVDLVGREGVIGKLAASLSDRPPFAVRAILFDKVPISNWSLGWHQDRTINVAERIELPGFGPWTVKQGMLHVQPPQPVIDGMITLRVHLDDVPEGNGPLRVLLGSHRLGKLTEGEIADVASQLESFDGLATSGDAWAYRTAIVHSFRPVAAGSLGRRVLQLDYACDALRPPMRWAMRI